MLSVNSMRGSGSYPEYSVYVTWVNCSAQTPAHSQVWHKCLLALLSHYLIKWGKNSCVHVLEMRKVQFKNVNDLAKDNGLECFWLQVQKTHLKALNTTKMWITAHKNKFSGHSARIGYYISSLYYQAPWFFPAFCPTFFNILDFILDKLSPHSHKVTAAPPTFISPWENSQTFPRSCPCNFNDLPSCLFGQNWVICPPLY